MRHVKLDMTLVPYLKKALEISDELDPKNTGQSQLGYGINALTIAYSKLRDWENVKYWIQIFFKLPDHFRDRSPNSEILKLQKRLDKSLKYLK